MENRSRRSAFFEMYRDRYFFVSNRIPTVYSFDHHLKDAEGKNEGKILGEGGKPDTAGICQPRVGKGKF